MKDERIMKAVADKLVPMNRGEYFLESEDRKVVTPENLGGLLEYPALFHAMKDNRELRPALSEAMTTGRAMSDFLTMKSEEFLEIYAVVDGPVNPKTGKPYGTDTKAYAEWRATQEKTPVPTDQYAMFGKMALAYGGHLFVQGLEDTQKHERVRNAVFEAEVCGVQCCCKIDSLYVGEDSAVAVDVKTTSDLCAFARSADALHYREQQALVLLILEANGIAPAQARIAAIEKGPMPRCGVFSVKDMEAARHAVESALHDYADSEKTGSYRTLFELPTLI